MTTNIVHFTQSSLLLVVATTLAVRPKMRSQANFFGEG